MATTTAPEVDVTAECLTMPAKTEPQVCHIGDVFVVLQFVADHVVVIPNLPPFAVRALAEQMLGVMQVRDDRFVVALIGIGGLLDEQGTHWMLGDLIEDLRTAITGVVGR